MPRLLNVPSRAAAAEFVATALLLAVVVGSGIMAATLAGTGLPGAAVALFANTLATGAGLVALIHAFGPVSGAHMNPAVTVAAAVLGKLPWSRVPGYLLTQIAGAFAGVVLAHRMFDLPLVTMSVHVREGLGVVTSEAVATFLLLFVALSVQAAAAPFAVAGVVVAGYWFTQSTCFANPAVTIARAFTDTYTGIRLADVPGFLLGEAVGAVLAVVAHRAFAHETS